MYCKLCSEPVVGDTLCPDCKKAVCYLERYGIVTMLGVEQSNKLLTTCKKWLDDSSGNLVPCSVAAVVVVHDLRKTALWTGSV